MFYVEIFRLASLSSEKATSTHNKRKEFSMARKKCSSSCSQIFAAGCHFVWYCILAQCQVITVSPEYCTHGLLGFILTINSTINPILYVMKDEIADFFKKKEKLPKGHSVACQIV